MTAIKTENMTVAVRIEYIIAYNNSRFYACMFMS